MIKVWIPLCQRQTNGRLKIISKNVEQYIGGKWLIDGTMNHKGKQLQSLEVLKKVRAEAYRGVSDCRTEIT